MARLLNLNSQTYNSYEKGTRIPGDILATIIEKLNVNANWLLLGEGEPFVTKDRTKKGRGEVASLNDAVEIIQLHIKQCASVSHSSDIDQKVLPLMEDAICAGDGLVIDDNRIEEWISLPRRIARGTTALLHVRGDSMIPTIPPDCIVGIDTTNRNPDDNNGKIIAARTEDEVVLKYLDIAKDTFILRSENPKYPAILFSDPKQILGKISLVLSEM